MGWWRRTRSAARHERTQLTTTYSIGDPRLGQLLNLDPGESAGVIVNEVTALGLSAWWRGCALISGMLAGLPLRALTQNSAGLPRVVPSILDAPGGTGPEAMTPYEWAETVTLHLINHGNAYLRFTWNGAGALWGLTPIHPLLVIPRWPQAGETPYGGKWFRVTDEITGESADYDGSAILQIPGLGSDRLAGISLLTAARTSLGTAIAGDRSAGRMFSRGAIMGGLATPDDDDLEPDEVAEARKEINSQLGWENAGGVAIFNRPMKLTPWTMTAADAQFLESRQYAVEDVARWTGVPPHLLMQTEKQTSWGTGVAEQNRGLARYTLPPWTRRIEQRLTMGLLRRGETAEFDYTALTRPVHEIEVDLVLRMFQAGIIDRAEARARLGWDPGVSNAA